MTLPLYLLNIVLWQITKTLYMEYLIVYAILCLIVGYLSSDTKLGFGSGFLLSVLLTPVVGFIIYLLYPAKQAAPPPNYQQHMPPPQLPAKNAIDEMKEKLQKLEEIKKANLITESEYQELRKRTLESN